MHSIDVFASKKDVAALRDEIEVLKVLNELKVFNEHKVLKELKVLKEEIANLESCIDYDSPYNRQQKATTKGRRRGIVMRENQIRIRRLIIKDSKTESEAQRGGQ